jgi:hypothetical protein
LLRIFAVFNSKSGEDNLTIFRTKDEDVIEQIEGGDQHLTDRISMKIAPSDLPGRNRMHQNILLLGLK